MDDVAIFDDITIDDKEELSCTISISLKVWMKSLIWFNVKILLHCFKYQLYYCEPNTTATERKKEAF